MSFAQIKEKAVKEWEGLLHSPRPIIMVGGGTCGLAAGASEVLEVVETELQKLQIPATLMKVGCIGLCYAEVLLDIVKPGKPRICYGFITPEVVPSLLRDYLLHDNPRPDLALGVFADEPLDGIPKFYDLPMLKPQVRIALRNCGLIDPDNILHYVARGGYEGFIKALSLTPEEVIEEVKRSGLRGRGGAGFPTGLKWEFCRKSPGSKKYLICNADEGDPGAFMDRSVLEADPHSVLEGMLIAAYAIGADEGYIYVRAEYPLAIERLHNALDQAKKYGLLGVNILGSPFSFRIHIREGAGAFVCGEETALIASIEGRRGMPRSRPPFPAQEGLFGKPTNINNVETLATVGPILARGPQWFSSFGTEKSKGTKTFALAGKVARPGLIEVPMGIPLRQIIYEVGGGIAKGKAFKAAQTGGPSGGCLPVSLLDIPMDYENLTQAGSIMGSGGLIVMDEDTCMVDVARFFLSFTQGESCGKCTLCRLGTKQMMQILEDICSGRAEMADLDLLKELGEAIKAGSLCGLGQTAPNPALTTLRYFPQEYEAHIKKKFCAAAVCKGLVKAPCSHLCPAGIEAPRYIRYILEGKYEEALAVNREKIPFPWVCGYVCFHPCESKCTRGQLDEPIAIRALKRFVADKCHDLWKRGERKRPDTGKRVAIIGSGPSGLTAAYYLASLGHSVTVFEKAPVLGGMMGLTIPLYRLPRKVLDEEIAYIQSLGVEIRTEAQVSSLDDLFQQGYNAIYLAIGTHRGLKLGIEGGEDRAVMDCITFLRKVNMREKVSLGQRVAVIGGGNAAIDSARASVRLGAREVTIIYRRSEQQMPADPEEVKEARHEGVKFLFLTAPVKCMRDNGKLSLQCIKMELGKEDESGRPRPFPIKGSEFLVEADTVIAAIGQQVEVTSGMAVPVKSSGTLEADPETLFTLVEGVFAGGDAVSGPSSIIEAIAAGRQAACSIDKFLGGKGEIDITPLVPPEEPSSLAALPEIEAEGLRIETLQRPPQERIKDFNEAEVAYTEEMAIREAKRCLRCDLEE